MFDFIKTKPATIKRAKRKGAYINANGRQYLQSLEPYTDLNTGITHYYNESRTKVKRIINYI